MVDVVLVLLSGVLGAVVLAVVLLHKAHKKDRARLTQLSAELAAQKIAAMTLGMPAILEPVEDSEPVRRKRHLGLFIGGGVAAFLGSIGGRVRDAWSHHRAVTATVTIAAASMAAVGAFALTSGGSTTPPTAVPTSGAPAGKPDPDSQDQPGDNDAPDYEAADEGLILDAATAGRAFDELTAGARAVKEPTSDASEAPLAEDDDQEQPDAGTPPVTNTPAPAPTSPSEPEAPATPGNATPTPEPSTPKPTVPQETPQQCTVGVALPPILELCLR